MAAAKSTPKDAQVMASILKEVGVSDYEPRVLNQMLEFTYRYVTNILEDAQQFSAHAGKKGIDIDDVKLAVGFHVDRHFTPPPSRELLLEISRPKNGTLLPLIKSAAGPRLPPDRYNLTACNYRLKSNRKQKVITATPRLNMSSLHPGSSMNKMNASMGLGNKGSGLSMVTKTITTPTVTVMPRPPPQPIIKISNGNPSLPVSTSGLTYSQMSGSMPSSQAIMPASMIKTEPPDHGEKRKRDDDDMDYDS